MTQARIESTAADPRVQKTRAALLHAFNAIILSKGYEAASPAAIAKAAGVGRSTFYEHYRGKADLLRRSLSVVLDPLAEAIVAGGDVGAVAFVLDHFWDNRRLARALNSGRPRAIMTDRLAELIEARLPPRRPGGFPPALAAREAAHGLLGMIEAWLTGRHGCSARTMAAHLCARAAPARQAESAR